MYRSNHKLEFIYIFLILILLVISFFNVFYKLGSFPISSWDEARHGVNAYEMLRKGNFIVSTYRNKIDYWNLKPPLSFWANMAGYKIAGFNALGLRLFSAICAMLTIIMVAVFVNKRHGKLASLISALTLATCTQFIINHSARTGDADSLFVCLFTAAMLSLLLCGQNDKWLYFSGFMFALAFLTKSWHAGNIAVIIGLYLLISGTYKRMSCRSWMLLCSCMILPILVWAALRYPYDGVEFFKKMITYDLLQRSSTSIEGHKGGKLYYVQILSRFFIFWLVLLFGLILVYLDKDFSFKAFKAEKKAYLLGICLWVIIPFILYTFTKTKIRWYILPIYPALSIIIGALASRLLLNGKLITKAFLLCSILFVSVFYEGKILTYLNHPIANPEQNLLQKIHGMEVAKRLKGYSLFMFNPSLRGVWPQNAVVTAELYGDLHVDNGDFNAFLRKAGALLLIQKGMYTEQLIKLNHLNIITSNDWGYIVSK